jgi:hypothetical protein
LFVVLVDPLQGLPLLRAILAIVKANDLDIEARVSKRWPA